MDIKSQNRHKIPAKRTFGRDKFICEYVFYIDNIVLLVILTSLPHYTMTDNP